MKNKYLHKLGCFMLAGSMLLTSPSAVFAAQLEQHLEAESSADETETEVKQEQSESEPPETSGETERQTDGTEANTETAEMPGGTDVPDGETEKKDNEGTQDIPAFPDDGDGSDWQDAPTKDSKNDKVKDIEEEGNTIHKPDGEEEQTDHSDSAAGYASNIIAGNDVYLGELSSEYGLSFADKFESVMDEIEKDYCEFLDAPDEFVAENWQDVLAVYVMKHDEEDGPIVLDAKCRDELEKIFFVMNLRSNSAMLRKLEAEESSEASDAGKSENAADEETADIAEFTETSGEKRANRKAGTGVTSDTEEEGGEENISDRENSSETKKTSVNTDVAEEKEYYALSVQDYITLYDVNETEKELLEKYTSTECRQLCAIVTAAKGFVRAEAGMDVSEERISIVAAACSLVGKVGYFWGGKSYAIGWDDRWGDPMTVSASGSKSSGTVRSYGLDCSGFVAWSYYNGLNGKDAGIGNHTTTQWNATEMVDSQEAKPGDLVFYRPGSAGDDNHVGIVIGVNDNGSLLVAHCSSGQNGVVTGEAWSAGFQYVRSPLNLE